MYKKIILAYDGSLEGQKALINCKEMASWANAEIHLLSVVPDNFYSIGEGSFIDVEAQKENYQRQLDNGVELIKTEGFKCIGVLLVGNSVKEITRYAAKVSADLIVMGHKHQDSAFGRWWARSTSSNIVEESPCNVLVVVT
jgi:nucleotide-binding universal stress UspA family protein